jgi:hypothetical protein
MTETFKKDGKEYTAIVDQWGEVRAVPTADITSGRAADEGMRVATTEEVTEARKQKKFGEGVATVQAGAEGLARGLTAGLSDPTLRALGVSAEGLRERQERNEILSTAGEAVGLIAPILLTGGGAGGARLGMGALRYAPTAAIARGGLALERGLAGQLGKGALSRVAAGTLAAAGEGAVYGAGEAISEAALGDVELTAERLLAGMKTGALLAGGAGAGIFGAGALVSKLAPKVADWTPTLLSKHMNAQSVERFIGETAFQAAKGPGAGKRFVERAKRSFAKYGDDALPTIGRHLLDEGVVTARTTVEDVANRAAVKLKEWGGKIGGALKRLDDEAALEVRPLRQTIAKRLEGEVLAPLRASKLPDFQNMARKVERTLDPFLAEGQFARVGADARISFVELHGVRAQLDDLIYRTDRASPVIEELRKARAVIEDTLEGAADKASKRLGDQFYDAYKGAKEKYSAMKIAKEMSEDAASRLDTNRNFSMSDMQVGQVAGIGEAVAGGGIDAGTLAFGFVAGRIHRLIRERGAAFVAGTLDNASRYMKLNAAKATADRTAKKLETGTKKFFRLADEAAKVKRFVGPAAAQEVEAEPLHKTFDRKAAEHREFQANPDLLVSRMTESFEGIGDDAPRVHRALVATAQRAATFLAAKNPEPYQRPSDVFAHLDDKQRVSDTQMAKYLRYAKAVEDPMSVIDNFADGTVTREGAEALREVYPKLFADVERVVTEQITERKEPLPYAASLHLSLMLDRPLHPSLEPRFIARAQAVHQAIREQKRKAPGRVPRMAEDQKSASQQVA